MDFECTGGSHAPTNLSVVKQACCIKGRRKYVKQDRQGHGVAHELLVLPATDAYGEGLPEVNTS